MARFVRTAFPVIVALAWPALAQAQQQPADSVVNKDFGDSRSQRFGFSMGLAGNFGLGHASGYPNEADKVGRSAFEANTGLGLGGGGDVWLGGAFNDYFVFGLGASVVGVSGDGLEGTGWAAGAHADFFPLHGWGGIYQDLGLDLHVGAGSFVLNDEAGEERAMGGSMSLVGAGVYWEALRFWKFAAGPRISYRHMWSAQTMEVHAAQLGFRISLYSSAGAPVAEKKTTTKTLARR